jgi:PIN domain nuclease of toxin-antitoxin system
MSSAETLVLDTHVFLWFYEGVRVSRRVVRRIEAAAASGALCVAAMTPWEIAMGAKAGRLRLRGTVLGWIESALTAVSAAVAPVVPAIAVDAVELPWGHRDPIDRLIVATARHLGGILVTADTEILEYATTTKAVRVLDAD